MYAVRMLLLAKGPSPEAISDHTALVMDHLGETDEREVALLDWSVGVDASTGEVEYEATIEADSQWVAVQMADVWMRTAIHAAGGSTPGWEDTDPVERAVCWALDVEEGTHVRPLVSA